jgi:hypothetical protein
MRAYLLALGFVALAVPTAAFAVDPASPDPSPAQMCKEERKAMGVDAFKLMHGTKTGANALGKCVSKKTKELSATRTNAAKQCRAEQSDSSFASAHGDKTFDQFYGTSKNGANAFGKCVSSKANDAVEESHEAVMNAAKRCKTERTSDPAAFKTKYGSHGNKSNAYGKCVSKLARE